jgi:ferredoxin
MPTITVNDGISFEAPASKRLVLALMDAGIPLMHRCGGNARCTTCRVHFIEGEPAVMTSAEERRLSDQNLLGEIRLSCQIPCDHDMTLEAVMLAHSPTDDVGPRPSSDITPPPDWVKRPY